MTIPSLFYFLFIVQFIFLVFMQNSFLNTGDGGEMVAGAYGLGAVHPSGYPVYLLLGKLFTFIPIGSIPYKVVLVSSFFGSLSAVLLGYIVFDLFKCKITSSFASLTLSFGFSFFFNSVVAKFYTANCFLILLIMFLTLKVLKEYDSRIQHTISFLIGITLALHHTGLFVGLGLLIVVIIHFKNFIKNIFPSLILLFSGFALNLYLFARSDKQLMVSLSKVDSIGSFIGVLTRATYKESSSLNAPKLLIDSLDSFYYSSKNVFDMLLLHYDYLLIIIFLIGVSYLLVTKRLYGFIMLLYFISYSVILSKLTTGTKALSVQDIYIIMHQYYLPLHALFLFFVAVGFYMLGQMLKKYSRHKRLYALVLLIPLSFIPLRIQDSSYSNNDVVYDRIIDILYTLPVKSVLIVTGDNDSFQTFYKKGVEKFRDDLCVIVAPTIDGDNWDTRDGCSNYFYKGYIDVNENNRIILSKVKNLMANMRVYSVHPVEENRHLKGKLKSVSAVMSNIVFPVEWYEKNKDVILEKLRNRRRYYDDFIHYESCFNHNTEDYFTKVLCLNNSIYLYKRLRDESEKGGTPMEIDVKSIRSDYKVYFRLNEDNQRYLDDANKIIKRNDHNAFPLYSK